MQSAYKSGLHTKTTPLRVRNDIIMAIGKRKRVFLVLLDLSAAFDMVNHQISLQFLKAHVELSGSVFYMFKSYRKGRSQCIFIHNALSSLSQLVLGVPQGSVLEPITFCIYTPPLSAMLLSHKIMYHIYTDDTQLYCIFMPPLLMLLLVLKPVFWIYDYGSLPTSWKWMIKQQNFS